MTKETIRTLRGKKAENALTLYYCGSESCSPGHSFGPAVRPHYLIHFIRSGRGVYFRKGEEYRLEKGDAFLILPGESTRYCADEEEPWEYTWVAFDGYESSGLLESCGFDEGSVVFRSFCEDTASELLSQVLTFEKSFHECANNELRPLGHFYLLFSCMIRDTAALPISKSTQEDSRDLYFRRAVAYLEHNFSYPVTIEQTARQIGVSRSYLYRSFKACCGKSVQQYLLDIRLTAASNLLQNTSMDVTGIAYSCGFGDSPSFCRQFKKAFHVTPLHYRRQFRPPAASYHGN